MVSTPRTHVERARTELKNGCQGPVVGPAALTGKAIGGTGRGYEFPRARGRQLELADNDFAGTTFSREVA